MNRSRSADQRTTNTIRQPIKIRPQPLLKNRPDAPMMKTSPTAGAMMLETLHESKVRSATNAAHKPTAAQRQASARRHIFRNLGSSLHIAAKLNVHFERGRDNWMWI